MTFIDFLDKHFIGVCVTLVLIAMALGGWRSGDGEKH